MLERVWPETPLTPAGDQPHPYVRSYVFMRFAIGVLGAGLILLLLVVEPILFDTGPWPRGSLSAYYYSGMREYFVGALFAIGWFLMSYKGGEFTRESRAGTYSGMAVLFVAVFPTGRPRENVELNPLQDLLGEKAVEGVHYASAAVFIVMLGVICFYFGRYAEYGERFRRLHYTSAIVIGGAVALAVLHLVAKFPPKGILIAEVAAVAAFTASWMATVDFRLLFPPMAAAQDD